jgi:hypothetical protein
MAFGLIEAVGFGIDAFAKLRAGDAAEKTSEFNAGELDAARQNDEQETLEQIRRMRTVNRRQRGSNIVAAAKSGFAPDKGSSLDVLAENVANMELAVQDEKRAQEVRSRKLRSQSALTIWEGKQQKKASRLSAMSSAVRGVGSIFGG